MAELHYQETFTGVASQTTDIVLAGQVNNAPVSADYTIQVSADLSGLLTYSGAYTSGDIVTGQATTYPAVTVDSTKLSAAPDLVTTDTLFRNKDAEGLFLTGANNITYHLQGLFKTLTWVYDPPAFEEGTTPVEAVINVSFGTLTATTFAEAISAGTWTYAGGADASNAAVNLFEQCLAAGKISGATLNSVNDGGAAVFADGDSVSVYVTYTLTKTRSYTVDPDHSGSGDQVSITVGNVTISDTTAATESAVVEKTVRWKFVHAGPV